MPKNKKLKIEIKSTLELQFSYPLSGKTLEIELDGINDQIRTQIPDYRGSIYSVFLANQKNKVTILKETD